MQTEDEKNRLITWFLNESPDLAEARDYGVDLWALWHNLHRTPAERMRRHDIALQTLRQLRNAKKVQEQ